VTLTAGAATGSTFTGWSGGGCSGTGTCVVTLTAATTVTATFTLPTFTLTLTKSGTGTGTVTSAPAGINCGATCVGSYTSGTTVTLTANPGANAVFAGWSGGACSGTGTCATVLTSSTAITAVFALSTDPSFTLTVSIDGSAAGTVPSSPAGINCGSSCSGSYRKGTPVLLTANAAGGAVFKMWRGVCAGTAPTCIVTMDAAKSATAVFSQTFTDGTGPNSTITAQSVVVKSVYAQELRAAINTLRARNNLAAFAWTDPTIGTGMMVKRIHFSELRLALTQAYAAAGRAAPVFTDSTITSGVTVIKAVHLNELRDGVRNLE
jgi:hypothetical protein